MNRLLEGGPDRPDDRERSRTKSKNSRTKDGRRPTKCRDLFSNLSEYLDGRIEPRSCEEMRGHIEACPACVAFLRNLRIAIDRCRSLEIPCDSAVAPRLRSILTQEYLRLLGMPSTEKMSALV
jgi:RNA polymerase sigma-70 factor (ECF subfamily)